MKEQQIEIVIELLRATLGTMSPRDADRVVAQCINLLELAKLESKK